MAGEDTRAAEPKPGESGQEQEKVQAESEAGNQQPQRGGQQQVQSQPSRPLSQAPLPPAHFEMLKNQPLPAPPPQGVHFGPLPYEADGESVDFERPFYPSWHRAKITFHMLSLVVCAVIFAMGITIGMFNAPYYMGSYDVGPADYELGTSGAAAGLAVVVTMWEFLKLWRSSRRRGLHPGSLVAFHLIIWLLAVVAIVVVAIYASDNSYYYYSYPRASRLAQASQNRIYEQVLLGFDCVLLAIHFILFVGACVETNKLEKAKRKVVVVQVPVSVNGAYPGGQYPAYGPRQSFVPPPGWQPGQYPAPLVAPTPPEASGGAGPAPPPPATLYGGYYAPAPQNMAWAPARNAGNAVPIQGYYAPPLPPRRHSNSRRNSRGEQVAPALASSSGSRRSQRRSQTQAAAPSTGAQEQAKPAEAVTERSA